MGAVVSFTGASSSTHYMQVRDAGGQVWNTSGTPAFEAYNAANWADYAVSLSEQGSSGVFTGTVPGVGAGVFHLTVFVQAGGSPAQGDSVSGDRVVHFDGTDLVSASVLGDGAVTSDAVASGAIASGAFAAGAIDAAAIGTGAVDADAIATDAITAAKIANNAIGAAALATNAVEEIRDAITGGAYALDTDGSGRVRIVSGTAAGELSVASGVVDSSVVQLGGDATAATRLQAGANAVVTGTVEDTTTTPTTSVFAASDITEATADHFVGRVVVFLTGALAGQSGEIADYALAGGEGKFTLADPMTDAPADGDTFVIT